MFLSEGSPRQGHMELAIELVALPYQTADLICSLARFGTMNTGQLETNLFMLGFFV